MRRLSFFKKILLVIGITVIFFSVHKEISSVRWCTINTLAERQSVNASNQKEYYFEIGLLKFKLPSLFSHGCGLKSSEARYIRISYSLSRFSLLFIAIFNINFKFCVPWIDIHVLAKILSTSIRNY